MILERRAFLKALGAAGGAAGLGACGGSWRVPDRLVERALRGPGLEDWRATTCGLCEGGCGLLVRTVDGVPVGIKGNPSHPLNRGGLCPVGQGGLEILYSPERLEQPLRRERDGELRPTSWEDALTTLSERLAALREAGEGRRIALLSGSASGVFNDLAERFLHTLGSPNFARSQAAKTLPFLLTQGLHEAPGVDLGAADLVLSFGLDLYEDGAAPVHAISATVGTRADGERATLLHVGTRLSPSATKAREYVLVRPGTHVAFALGVAHVLVREGLYDRDFVGAHTWGFEDWTDEEGRERLGFRRLLLERYYPDRAAALCGCKAERIPQVARLLAGAGRGVAVAGGDALSGSNATWTAMAVSAVNALVGAFDRPGGVVLPPPIPLTPLEPLETPLPEASIFAADEGAGAFGIDPVEGLASRALEGPHSLEALLVVDADPVHSSPLGERLRGALRDIPMVVAFSPFLNDTAAAADLVLPTPSFLESWEAETTPATVGVSVLGITAPVVEPVTESRHPGDVLLELARRLEGTPSGALPWAAYGEYLQHRVEGLWSSGEGSALSGSFEESWVQFLEERGWRFLEHDDLESFWEDLVEQAGWWNPVREKGHWERLLRTPSGRFEFFSRTLESRLRHRGAASNEGTLEPEEALRLGCEQLGLVAAGDEACLPHYEPPGLSGEGDLVLVPFRPITARGRLATFSPMVMEMSGYPHVSGWATWVEIAPETAERLHLAAGDRVGVESGRGLMEAVVKVRPGLAPEAAQIPFGLGQRGPDNGDEGLRSNPMRIVERLVDPLSGDLATSSTRVRLRLLRRRPHGGPAPWYRGET